MKTKNNYTAKVIFALFTAALINSPVFSEENANPSLEDEITQQGDMALMQMKTQLRQNAFWRQPPAEQLAQQLDEQDFAPETAGATDCDRQSLSRKEKKTPTISPATIGQPG